MFSSTVSGGTWSSSTSSVANIDPSTGIATGLGAGTTIISYTVAGTSGCPGISTANLTVSGAADSSVLFPSGTVTLCHGLPVDMQVISTDTTGLGYQWYFNGFPLIGANSRTFAATAPGSYNVEITNSTGTRMLVATTVVGPPDPIISMAAGHILYTGSFVTYQWLKDSVLIPGETSSVLTSTGYGTYQVIVSDANGCTDTSLAFVDTTWLAVNDLSYTGVDVSIFPNPATTTVHVESSVHVNAVITTADGKVMMRKDDARLLDVSSLTPGLYLISIYDQYNTLVKTARFVKAE
jgi:hypothetical protein